ncbi:MAG: GGDEF domain-containing protein [Spirochaetia bacterium]|nr:GGDEF domain-containing protein [Spirochaetota bacterium]MDW8112924.1 GGDEF domain-containing protein [Spirochaetia bacterium]
MPLEKDIPSRNRFKTLFRDLDKSIKIINEFSEFLKLLDLREVEILKVMMVRFMIEATNSESGGLIEIKESEPEFTEIFQYKSNRIIDKDFSSVSGKIQPDSFEGITLETTIKRKIPTLFEDESIKSSVLASITKVSPSSIIQVPVILEDRVEYVIELLKKSNRKKHTFSEGDISSLSIISNIASAIFTNAQLFNSAIHDNLTGLYNIHYFKNLVLEEMMKVMKFKTNFSLAIMDLDHFKNINDTYGHSVGDEALKFFSKVIRQEIKRSSDIVARYGGDEFISAFPSTDANGAYLICSRIRDKLNSELFSVSDTISIKITPSIGIAEISQDEISNAKSEIDLFRQLFLKADTALYNSKKTGRNRVTVFSPNMSLIQIREL